MESKAGMPVWRPGILKSAGVRLVAERFFFRFWDRLGMDSTEHDFRDGVDLPNNGHAALQALWSRSGAGRMRYIKE